jgi:hypothetical protein
VVPCGDQASCTTSGAVVCERDRCDAELSLGIARAMASQFPWWLLALGVAGLLSAILIWFNRYRLPRPWSRYQPIVKGPETRAAAAAGGATLAVTADTVELKSCRLHIYGDAEGAGHVAVGVEHWGKLITWGLYPTDTFASGHLSSTEGEVRVEDPEQWAETREAHGAVWRLVLFIHEEQCRAARTKAAELMASQHTWSALGYNCMGFARDVAAAAGYDLPIFWCLTASDIPFQESVYGSGGFEWHMDGQWRSSGQNPFGYD